MKLGFPDIIILAGGFGTRLQSIVKDVPKPMAPIADRPFLKWLLEYLAPYNPSQFILSTGYKHEVIEDYFGNNFQDIPIVYSIETEPLGTGGAIKKAMTFVNTDNALVLNGDTFFGINHSDLFAFHLQQNSIFTMALKPMETPTRYGTVTCFENRILQFNEKDENCIYGLINTGVYLLSKNVTGHFPLDEKFSFEKDFLELKTDSINMLGYSSESYFIDIGIPEDFQKANNEFPELFHTT